MLGVAAGSHQTAHQAAGERNELSFFFLYVLDSPLAGLMWTVT